MKLVIATLALFTASLAAHAEAVPANACQAKALAAAHAEIVSTLGVSDAEAMGIRETKWVVSISFHSESDTTMTNPNGSIETLTGIFNVKADGDCDVHGVSVDEYNTNG